ncbi:MULTISPECIES: hypothetical protein [Stenotrophomonas maltophilia group]|uniref:hypothetical protein n=1 Tax=Stenotrophomonas maltophilia group TaxID=995085 RepID=UPI00131056B1|nr:hypothetical protein [Stenotrophomonas maltophilia]
MCDAGLLSQVNPCRRAPGGLCKAVPVPKDRGSQVFEEIARRGVDPGLLEQARL